MSNERPENRMLQLVVHGTVGQRMIVCHLTRQREISIRMAKTIKLIFWYLEVGFCGQVINNNILPDVYTFLNNLSV